MKKRLLPLLVAAILLFIGLQLSAQVSINTDGSQPDPSAGLDVKFNNKGILLPRITKEQRNAINSPANGLMVFCTNCGTDGSLSIYSNGSWRTFAPCVIPPPVAGSHVMSQGQIIWNWLASPGATGYKWSTTAVYATAIEIGTNLSKTETGTNCNVTYTRYVWAYSGCGESGMTTLTQAVPASAPATPTAGTHVATKTSIEWNWTSVAGATGYKWGTTNVFSTATDMGTATTTTETGLTCGTSLTRYLWSYNGCGFSTSLTLTQSTLSCWACGDPFTITHIATGMPGAVAPVTKTVTYGTVTNITGELTKCWITSNLGADHQATSVNDGTEPSAGWYWQFNRKQGYKHDGTIRTPNTTWITDINESFDWQAAEDPCVLEFPNGWRIPTKTEWDNVIAWGPWGNWNGPWNSGLKMHAAGYLSGSNGFVGNRGTEGFYWSSMQYSSNIGWYMYFYSSGISMNHIYHKESGQSLRCIKE